MKQLLVSVGMVLTAGLTIAQSDGVNKEKYWKFRTDFREKYVKIGPNQGESLPAGSLQPLACVDNINYDGTGYGTMFWGDGMIRQGHYLGLLATEYRLLKNAGKDVSGVLNELYFALRAFNRLDYNAELEQATFYNFTLPQNTNGFYMREDVYEDFATNNWGNDPMEMRCTNSAFYKNNNAAKQNASTQWGEWYAEGNSYQNVPSQDQMSSLLVGFSLIHKLVDDEFVQPAGETQGFSVVTETKAIVDRMVRYCADHNWFVIDVNGWPVNNGGGDLVLTAHPILKIAERITGNSYTSYNGIIKRRAVGWQNIYHCLTGFGLNGVLTTTQQVAYCAELGAIQQAHAGSFLEGSEIAGPLNNQNISMFQNWQLSSNLLLSTASSSELWNDLLPEDVSNLYDDWYDDHRYNSSANLIALPWLISYLGLADIEFDQPPIKDYSATILFNLGVASGLWSSSQINSWGNGTGNRQLELINNILNNQSLTHSQNFYKAFLDQMPYEGPYHFLESVGTKGQPDYEEIEGFQSGGWAAEYRWTHPAESVGDGLGKGGIYSGLDYMLFHNLYWLAFNSSIQMTETNELCPCASPIVFTPNGNETNVQLAMVPNLNSKLSYLPTCVPSALAPTFNMVATTFDIQPKFSNYIDWNIFPTKYQLQNASVEAAGTLNVKTHLVVCDNTLLNVKAGGTMNIDESSTLVNVNAKLEVSGLLRIKSGTELTVKGKLIVKNGGQIMIENGGRLVIDYTGSLEYYNGAEIMTNDATNNVIILRGSIRTMDAATFSIISLGSASQAGRFIIDSPTAAFYADQPSHFRLKGKSITDPYLVINPNCNLTVQDPDIRTFRVDDCSVEVKGGAFIKAEQPFYSSNTNYFAAATNGGMTLTDVHNFVNCQFLHVPIKATLNVENTSPFVASGCTFTANSTIINPTDLALITVTGMSFQLANCVFVGNRNYGIRSSNMVTPANATGCTFSQFGASGTTMIGISDISNVEVKATSSIFTKCFSGITKASGKLSLKCNTFNTNTSTNVSVTNGCALNMTTSDLAGYNYMNKTTQNKNIQLSASTINLRTGYNFIEQCTNTVFGILSTTCTFPNCTINFSDNQWNLANTVPALSLFQISSANLLSITPSVATVTLKPACGYYDGPIVIGPPKGKSTFDTDGMPIIYSAMAADSMRLDHKIIAGMERMTVYDDSLGNDLEAVEHFNEVYTSDVDLSDSLTKNLLWFTLEQMKSSLENAVAHGQITTSQNTVSFEPHVGMYANALMKMTDAVIDEDNYMTQFYHEIDKAHLFRVIGHSEIGLNILTELEACGIDSTEQTQLNYWKQEFEKDLVIEEIGFAAMDSIIEIDTSGYLNPALVVNAYSFGAIIHSMNDIQYPNCSFFEHRDQQWKSTDLVVFPNPASDEVTIRWNIETSVGQTTIVIQQADGKVVLSKKMDNAEANSMRVTVSNWKPGVYQVRVTQANGKQFVAQLVIQ